MTTHECVLCGKKNSFRFLITPVEGYNYLTHEHETQYFCKTHDNPFERLAARDRKKIKRTKAQRRKRQLQTYQRTVKEQGQELAQVKGKLAAANQLLDSYDAVSQKLLEETNELREQTRERGRFLEAISIVFPATKERIDAFLEPPARVNFHPLSPYRASEYHLKNLSRLRGQVKS